jgi:hypothetical protein
VGGRSQLVFEEDPPDWLGPDLRLRLSEVDLGDNRRRIFFGTRLYGLNLAIRKTVFGFEGGFDETLGRIGNELTTGEETALLQRIAEEGRTIIYDPDVVVRHIIEPARLRWNYFTALAAGAGQSKERKESRRNRLYQLLRIGRALWYWGRSVFVSAQANVLNRSRYERKVAKFDIIASRSLFWHRLKRIWH